MPFGEDPRDREALAAAGRATGAVICGRRTYDDSVRWWGADGPTAAARVPVIVVTHSVPSESPDGGVYTFVTGGIEQALEEATTLAGQKTVCVMGGAEMGRQYLDAGLVDEISIHLVPVLFGGGLSMFDGLVDRQDLAPVEAIQTPAATHLRYRVVR